MDPKYSTKATHARNAGSGACTRCGNPPQDHVKRDPDDEISLLCPGLDYDQS